VVVGFDRAKVTVDGVEAEKLGAGRRMTGEIRVPVLHPDVVRKRQPIKIFVTRSARYAKIRDGRGCVGLTGVARPSGKAERRRAREGNAALAREAREAAEAFRARLACAVHVDGALWRAP